MKRIVIYSILLCFLSYQGGMRQLFKLPGLLIHFVEHKLEDPEMTLSEFVHTHYCHDHSHAHSHCNQLPNQENDIPQPHFQFVSDWPQFTLPELKPIAPEHGYAYLEPHLHPAPLDFWQPPKV